MPETRNEDPDVPGSNPGGGTIHFFCFAGFWGFIENYKEHVRFECLFVGL